MTMEILLLVIDKIASVFQVTRSVVVFWLLVVGLLSALALALWLTNMPLEAFYNWSIALVFFAIVLAGFRVYVITLVDEGTKKYFTKLGAIVATVAIIFMMLVAGNHLGYQGYRTWYPDDRVKPRRDFSGQFLSYRGDFANNWFYRTKVAEDKTEDSQIKERDKWQQWLINGCPLGENGDKQLVCIVSDEFGNDLNPIKFELTLHGDYKIDSAYAFLKSNLESVNRYRPQYRQVPVAREGAEGKHYITVQFPNANEKLWIVAAVSTRDGTKVPDKFSGFQFQLLPVSSK